MTESVKKSLIEKSNESAKRVEALMLEELQSLRKEFINVLMDDNHPFQGPPSLAVAMIREKCRLWDELSESNPILQRFHLQNWLKRVLLDMKELPQQYKDAIRFL